MQLLKYFGFILLLFDLVKGATLTNLSQSRYGCSSPFIAERFRGGASLCENITIGRLVNDFLVRSVPLTGIGQIYHISITHATRSWLSKSINENRPFMIFKFSNIFYPLGFSFTYIHLFGLIFLKKKISISYFF